MKEVEYSYEKEKEIFMKEGIDEIMSKISTKANELERKKSLLESLEFELKERKEAKEQEKVVK